jgi:hypothetical protein
MIERITRWVDEYKYLMGILALLMIEVIIYVVVGGPVA